MRNLLAGMVAALLAVGMASASVDWSLTGGIGSDPMFGGYYSDYLETGLVDLTPGDTFDFSSIVSVGQTGELVTIGSASVEMAPGSTGSFSLDRTLNSADLAYQNVSFTDSMLLSGGSSDATSELTAQWFAQANFDEAQLGAQLSAANVRNFQFLGSGGLVDLQLNATDLLASSASVRTKFTLNKPDDSYAFPVLGNIAMLNVSSFNLNLDNISPNFV